MCNKSLENVDRQTFTESYGLTEYKPYTKQYFEPTLSKGVIKLHGLQFSPAVMRMTLDCSHSKIEPKTSW